MAANNTGLMLLLAAAGGGYLAYRAGLLCDLGLCPPGAGSPAPTDGGGSGNGGGGEVQGGECSEAALINASIAWTEERLSDSEYFALLTRCGQPVPGTGAGGSGGAAQGGTGGGPGLPTAPPPSGVGHYSGDQAWRQLLRYGRGNFWKVTGWGRLVPVPTAGGSALSGVVVSRSPELLSKLRSGEVAAGLARCLGGSVVVIQISGKNADSVPMIAFLKAGGAGLIEPSGAVIAKCLFPASFSPSTAIRATPRFSVSADGLTLYGVARPIGGSKARILSDLLIEAKVNHDAPLELLRAGEALERGEAATAEQLALGAAQIDLFYGAGAGETGGPIPLPGSGPSAPGQQCPPVPEMPNCRGGNQFRRPVVDANGCVIGWECTSSGAGAGGSDPCRTTLLDKWVRGEISDAEYFSRCPIP